MEGEMNNNTKINGIHHVTAIASSAPENLEFYENVLGLRLVKKTVNFDDPYTYHLYYSDLKGAPGTIMTFFPWENLPRGKAGAGMVTTTAFSIPFDAVDFWVRRLSAHGIKTQETVRFGDRVIRFEDPHGLSLDLVGVSENPATVPDKISAISSNDAVLGLHSATALLNSLEETRILLVDLMGMTLQSNEGNRFRFRMDIDDPVGGFYDVILDPWAENGRQGGGTVHHVAFRTPTDDGQIYWQKLMADTGFSVTPIRDRKYFKSIYFNEPGGVLFEIATDSPGFAMDETYETLGRDLKLPDQYESMRAEIESRLPNLHSAEFDRDTATADI
jgi:glyoxalase family protein